MAVDGELKGNMVRGERLEPDEPEEYISKLSESSLSVKVCASVGTVGLRELEIVDLLVGDAVGKELSSCRNADERWY